ncbi:hypothetical protein GJ697_15885 [Pseudoduganella sp. FT25W]|uniref:DUF3828 domain-containing protein n=1 Tax=Duganella alba TaxID=2666081 RepID=A0A6L5QJZ9_9BURK|nr:hypothetical protein [Duganella alba]MRX09321.1 hypothetical protein [Duganella alba]MRX17157.1 hypothetical protein [Duganella alba]
MKINTKRLLPFGAVLLVLAIAGLLADKAWSEKQQQLDLITDFYRDHLARPDSRLASQLPPGTFYSRELEALVDANSQLCYSLSRGDDVCGYGADADVFLQTQEASPTLDFDRSSFKVSRVGENIVEATFNVYPDMGTAYDRQIRYVLVEEDEGWRVDDMLFSDGRSMRQEIQQENDAILSRARDLGDTAGWVFNYLGNEEMLDRAVRFIAFPVQVCDQYGACAAMKRDDPRLLQALDALADSKPDIGNLPKPGDVQASDGKVVAVSALDFTFQNRAWWVNRIDLRRLPASPLAPRHE